MFKEVGETNNWYTGDAAWIYESEDAWLFACYYDEDVTSMNPDLNDDTNTDNDQDDDTTVDNENNDSTDDADDKDTNTNGDTSNTETETDKNVDTSNKSPETGDNSVVALTVAMLSAAAVVFGTKAKK